MEVQRKFLNSLSLETDLSAVAAVTHIVIYIMYAVQMSRQVVASDAFLKIEKEAISLADFNWAIFYLKNVLMESI